MLLVHPAQSLARVLNDNKVPSRGGVERAPACPSPSGNSLCLALYSQGLAQPLASIFTFCFPLAIMSVHQRLGSAKREGPREGGSEPEEAKHPGALPPLVPKQEGGGTLAEMAGRSLSDQALS